MPDLSAGNQKVGRPRREFIGVLGLIGTVGLAACVGDSPGESETSSGEGTTLESAYGTREEFEYGDVVYNVIDVTVGDRLYVGTRGYGAGEGAVLVRVRLKMTNTGTETIEVPLLEDVDPILTDPQDREYETKETVYSGAEISPDLSERALFYFEVPADQNERYLQIGPKYVRLTETITATQTGSG